MTDRVFLNLKLMALTKEQKSEILNALVEQMKEAKSVVFADFQGLSVKGMDEMRTQMREKGVKFQVAKKTLLKLAAKEAGFGEIPNEVLEGPVGAAFSMEGEIAAAKALHTFGKKNPEVKLRGALFEGRVLSIEETKELALLPSREELIGKFMYLVKYPVQGFHGVLHNTLGGFVRALNAVKEQKEQAA
jgi:large subunit ribosomal protein L10